MIRRLPSTDLYLTHSCGDLIARRWRRRPISALGANMFVADKTMILIRRDRDPLMRRALNWPGRLVYLIDDDVAGAAESTGLPGDYRRRLSDFDAGFHRRLLHRADTLLVPSDALAERLSSQGSCGEIRRIDPYWNIPIANQNHFSAMAATGQVRIVHLGSGSHGHALAMMAPSITRILAMHPHATFTYIGARVPDAVLARHPRVFRVAPMRWPHYRRWIARQRFHLALYPLDADPFDRARSINKLIEHGIVGAVGVYPEDWSPARVLQGAALFAPADPAAWFDTLQGALAHRVDLADIAALAARRLICHNDLAAQRRLWGEIVGIEVA